MTNTKILPNVVTVANTCKCSICSRRIGAGETVLLNTEKFVTVYCEACTKLAASVDRWLGKDKGGK